MGSKMIAKAIEDSMRPIILDSMSTKTDMGTLTDTALLHAKNQEELLTNLWYAVGELTEQVKRLADAQCGDGHAECDHCNYGRRDRRARR